MRILILFTLFSSLFTTDRKIITPFTPVENRFHLMWKSQIGNASYRTNLSLQNSYIVIGSNGDHFRDGNFFDSNSGVYVIDKNSGRIVSHFAHEKIGDMDVNGVVLYKGSCYFGNDNEEFICADLKGNIKWRKNTSGDIEHEPSLISRKEGDIIVYASEAGEVTAVDPITGKTIWNFFTPDFKGYKPKDNRMVFKIKNYFFSPTVLLNKPAIADLNSDGISDLIYSNYSNIYALNGKNGKQLWNFHTDNLLSNELVQSGTADYPIFTMIEINTKYVKVGDIFYSDNHFITFDKKGRLLEKTVFNSNNNWPGLNHFTTDKGEIIFSTKDSLYFLVGGNVTRTIYHGINYEHSKRWSSDSTSSNRNTREALFCQNGLNCNDNKSVFLLNQYDEASPDNAFIEIISLETGTVTERLLLPSRSEMAPKLTDLNGDGKFELLVSCYDGYLYCYETNIKS